MLRLAVSTVRFRKAGFVGAFLALSCAAALISASGLLLETGLRGGVPTERYAGSPIVVAGHQDATMTKHVHGKTKSKSKPLGENAWIPAALVDQVRAVPGVQAASPELTFPAAVMVDGRPVNGPAGSAALGHSWDSAPLTPFVLRAGRTPSAADEVVLDARVAGLAVVSLGGTATIQATGHARRYRVVGIATLRGGNHLAHQATTFFAPGEARRLAGHPGQVDAIGVQTTKGASVEAVARRIAAAVAATPAKVYVGDERGPLELLDAASARVKLISISATLTALSLLVAILVVALTFGLSIQQRARELALLRAVAATPKQVRRMITREAVVVGALGGVCGCAAGLLLAPWLRDRFVRAGAIPDTLRVTTGLLPLSAAFVATVVAAAVAARIAARRSARARPVDALTETAIEPSRPGAARLVAGVAVLVGAALLTAVLRSLDTAAAATPVTLLTTLAWATGVALVSPVLVRGATALLGAPLRWVSPVAGYFAAASTHANARRIASVVMPCTLAVAFTGTILFTQTTLDHAASRQAHDGTVADTVLRSRGPGIAPLDVARLRKIPGVEAVTEVLHTQVRDRGLEKYAAQGVTPRDLGRNLRLGVRAGSIGDLGAGTVALSTSAASRAGVRPGDRWHLFLGDGTPVTLRVVATYARGLGFGEVTLPHGLVARHVDDPLDDTVLIRTAPGARDAHAAIVAIVDRLPGVQVTNRAGLLVELDAGRRTDANVALLLMELIIAFTAIAAINSLTMATASRSRELALLRLVGMTRRQLLRMTRCESLVVAAIAIGLGTAISAVTLRAYSRGMTHSATPSVPVLTALAIGAAVALVTVVTSDLAARVAIRPRPIDGVRAPE